MESEGGGGSRVEGGERRDDVGKIILKFNLLEGFRLLGYYSLTLSTTEANEQLHHFKRI